jgi:hypothetical protein
MGIRNLLILFLSALAISLVILVVFFSLFFKNVDLTFDTHPPEAAPELDQFVKDQGGLKQPPDPSKAEGIFRSTINVPDETNLPIKPGTTTPTGQAPIEFSPGASHTPPEASPSGHDDDSDTNPAVVAPTTTKPSSTPAGAAGSSTTTPVAPPSPSSGSSDTTSNKPAPATNGTSGSASDTPKPRPRPISKPVAPVSPAPSTPSRIPLPEPPVPGSN